MNNKKRHRWTEDDDLVAFYLSRYGTRYLPLMEAGISKVLGMPEVSLIMRQSNFKYLHSGVGLRNVAMQSRRIYENYRHIAEITLRPMVLDVLESRSG